jgi:serine/threonine-protein kinase HipA
VVPELVSADLAQMYRRMAFNVLAGNRDDHLRNHGFLRSPEGWRLAPAFDLNPAQMIAHTTAVDGRVADLTMEHLLDARAYFDLATKPAQAILDEVGDAVGSWPELARDAGIPPSEQRLVAKALSSLPAFG